MADIDATVKEQEQAPARDIEEEKPELQDDVDNVADFMEVLQLYLEGGKWLWTTLGVAGNLWARVSGLVLHPSALGGVESCSACCS